MRPVSSQEKIITSQKKDRNNLTLTTQNKCVVRVTISVHTGSQQRNLNNLRTVSVYRYYSSILGRAFITLGVDPVPGSSERVLGCLLNDDCSNFVANMRQKVENS